MVSPISGSLGVSQNPVLFQNQDDLMLEGIIHQNQLRVPYTS